MLSCIHAGDHRPHTPNINSHSRLTSTGLSCSCCATDEFCTTSAPCFSWCIKAADDMEARWKPDGSLMTRSPRGRLLLIQLNNHSCCDATPQHQACIFKAASLFQTFVHPFLSCLQIPGHLPGKPQGVTRTLL